MIGQVECQTCVRLRRELAQARELLERVHAAADDEVWRAINRFLAARSAPEPLREKYTPEGYPDDPAFLAEVKKRDFGGQLAELRKTFDPTKCLRADPSPAPAESCTCDLRTFGTHGPDCRPQRRADPRPAPAEYKVIHCTLHSEAIHNEGSLACQEEARMRAEHPEWYSRPDPRPEEKP